MDDELESNLRCPICHDFFVDPKQLCCGHSFCKKCLEGTQSLYSVSCSICRKPTYLSMPGLNGINQLPTNYPLAQIVEFVEIAISNKSRSQSPLSLKSCSASSSESEQNAQSSSSSSNSIEDLSSLLPAKQLQQQCSGCLQQNFATKEAWICSNCNGDVFCSICVINNHRMHQVTQLCDRPKQWQKLCQQYDAVKGRIPEIELRFSDARTSLQTISDELPCLLTSEVDFCATLSEIQDRSRACEQLRWKQAEGKEMCSFEQNLKRLQFCATQVDQKMPVILEQLQKLVAAVRLSTSAVKDLSWSNLRQNCDENSRGYLSILFTWKGDLKQPAYLAGTFTNWAPSVKLVRHGGEHIAILDLPKGRHLFKFLVDGQWTQSPDWPTCTDGQGGLNNWIEF